MNPAPTNKKPLGPIRATGRFLLAVVVFYLARVLSLHGAHGLVTGDWEPLVEQAMFAFLLLFGYAGIGFVLDGQLQPVSEQGLPVRKGWLGEVGLGVAAGWAIAVVCVLPIVMFGGLALHLAVSLTAFAWLVLDAAFFALATLAMQIAFRGYPFQCAIRVIGELPAVLLMAILYGVLHAGIPGANRASMGVCIALGLLLSMAYLRTRAIWLPWGLHFGWVASRALLFGLPINGVTSHSPVIQGDTMGSFVWSGGGFGLDGSWVSFVVLLIALPFIYKATSDLSFQYNAPVLIPGGIAVDLDAAAKKQHEAATRADVPEVKPLVQILPAMPVNPFPIARDVSRSETTEPTSQN